jgi:hypothetical protein
VKQEEQTNDPYPQCVDISCSECFALGDCGLTRGKGTREELLKLLLKEKSE